MEEIRKWSLFVMCVMCYVVYYAIPNVPGAPTFKFFSYSDQRLTLPMYCHFWAGYISRMFFVLALDAFSKYQYSRHMRLLCVLELLAMANYFFRYGEDFFVLHFGKYDFPFDMMVVRIGAWVTVALINIFRHLKSLRKTKYATR